MIGAEASHGTDPVTKWSQIPKAIEGAIAGLSHEELDFRSADESMTARETVHHLVEANIIASSMIIAALGKSGATYDWSWLYPNMEWVGRLGYGSLPIGPALDAIRGLTAHVSDIVRGKDDALVCYITLFVSPGAETYTITVEQIISHEVAHAGEHLREIRRK